MPWKMVNVDGKRVSLKEAVDGIFSNQDELTNSKYITLKLYEKVIAEFTAFLTETKK